MILTICPNPSIDLTVEVDSLNVGMLNRIRNKVETYSGKALNVAKGIARLASTANIPRKFLRITASASTIIKYPKINNFTKKYKMENIKWLFLIKTAA